MRAFLIFLYYEVIKQVTSLKKKKKSTALDIKGYLIYVLIVTGCVLVK